MINHVLFSKEGELRRKVKVNRRRKKADFSKSVKETPRVRTNIYSASDIDEKHTEEKTKNEKNEKQKYKRKMKGGEDE